VAVGLYNMRASDLDRRGTGDGSSTAESLAKNISAALLLYLGTE
jgi:hypothetical protein